MTEPEVGDWVEWGYDELTGTILEFQHYSNDGEWALINPDDPYLKNRWVMIKELRAPY